jgi:exonuclease III
LEPQNHSPNFGYIGQFKKYLQINKKSFKNIVIAGDFNSNIIWNQWDRSWNHSDVIKELKELKIHSLYHATFKESQGEETKPTFFSQRKMEKAYHIDYVLGSTNLIKRIDNLEIGDFSKWIKLSDHLPNIFQLKK